MKKIIICIILLTISISANTGNTIPWGKKKNQVFKQLGKPYKKKPGVLLYKTIKFGHKWFVSYEFNKANKLYKTFYVFAKIHRDSKKYITQYFSVIDKIELENGKKLSGNITWYNETFKDNPLLLNIGLERGHFKVEHIGTQQNIFIKTQLFKKGKYIFHTITYINKSIK